MYKHGVYTSEVPTAITPPVVSTAGLTVVVGTAPIHLTKNPAPVNRPTLCYNYAEAVEQFGYSEDWESYTICEAIYSHFVLYNVAPLVIINVLDPHEAKSTVADQAVDFVKDQAILEDETIIPQTIQLFGDEGKEYEEGIDYVVTRTDEGIVITALSNIKKATATYDKVMPETIDKADIIGGIDTETMETKGLESVNNVFPLTRLVPNLLIAPGYSHYPEVAAVMKAKMAKLNGHFKGHVICDADPSIRRYTDVPKWKNDNNYVSNNQTVVWPMVQLGDKVFHYSTQLAGLINRTDAENEGIPYRSPSNRNLQMNGLVDSEGNEIVLDNEQANYLNGQGIVTAINFAGGHVAWGNRTAVYPAVSDPKDAFLSIRRMFDWVANSLVLSHWSKIDDPTNRRLVESVVDSANMWLNSLTPQYLLGAQVSFLRDDNPLTDLMDGKMVFDLKMTPPSPGRVIHFKLQYEPEYLNGLFD